MNERLKELRTTLKLNQSEFGEKLGVSRDVISNIELNRADIKEPFIKLLCKTFRVDYMWLTTGVGDMFMEADLDDFELIQDIISNQSEFAQNVFKLCCKLTEEDWKNIEKVAKNVSKYIKEIKEDTEK